MTYGEAVSRIINDVNALTKDQRLSKRWILSILKEVGEFLLSQKLLDKTLYRETDLFKWLKCVELKQDEIVKCPIVEFRRCKSLMRSKKKLPKIIGSKYGYAVLIVTTIDGARRFAPISLLEYTSMVQRRNYEKFIGTKYYIADNYLYIPDSEVEVVDMLILSLDEDCEDASGCSEQNPCQSVWEKEFPFPAKFANVIVQEALKEVTMRLQVPTDSNSDLDSNQKGATTQ